MGQFGMKGRESRAVRPLRAAADCSDCCAGMRGVESALMFFAYRRIAGGSSIASAIGNACVREL